MFIFYFSINFNILLCKEKKCLEHFEFRAPRSFSGKIYVFRFLTSIFFSSFSNSLVNCASFSGGGEGGRWTLIYAKEFEINGYGYTLR